MRRVLLSMLISVDGYMEGPNRSIDWHRVDDELHEHFNDEFRTMGAFLDGRVTYDLMADFWPTADADPASPPPMREFAQIWRDMPKIVFSRTVERAGWNTQIWRDVVVSEIEELKAQEGGDLALGGAELAAEFRRLDLIDEYRLYVNPVLLGGGKPLFAPTDESRDLELIETRAFSNGVVLLRYGRTVPTAPGRAAPGGAR